MCFIRTHFNPHLFYFNNNSAISNFMYASGNKNFLRIYIYYIQQYMYNIYINCVYIYRVYAYILWHQSPRRPAPIGTFSPFPSISLRSIAATHAGIASSDPLQVSHYTHTLLRFSTMHNYHTYIQTILENIFLRPVPAIKILILVDLNLLSIHLMICNLLYSINVTFNNYTI